MLGLMGLLAGRPPVLVIEQSPAFKLDMAKGALCKNWRKTIRIIRPSLSVSICRNRCVGPCLAPCRAHHQAFLDLRVQTFLKELPSKGKEDERAGRWCANGS